MEWISVESPPTTYEEVLLFWEGDCYLGHYQVHDGGTDGKKAGNWYVWADDGSDVIYHPTHWMPLPDPPKG